MAVIDGFLSGRFLVQIDNPYIDPGIFELDPINLKSGGLVGAGEWAHFQGYAAPPVSQEISVYFLEGYSYDFYYRIYITPSAINAGNVLSRHESTVFVWNAFPYQSKTLTSAAVAGDSGTSVELPFGMSLPYEIRPLQEIEFGVVVGLSGPPNINATFTLSIEGEDYVVPIVGRRIVLFPFEPQWRGAVDETITVRSWSIGSEDGSEQTGTIWGESAARTFEYNTVLKTAEEMQRAENLLFTWQGRFFGLPIWTEKRRLTAQAVSATDTVQFDTTGFSVEPGALVVLWDGPEHNEIKEVLSFDEDSVTFSTVLGETWPIDTVVYPLAVALLGAQVAGQRETSGVVRMPLMFECEPSATPSNIDAAPPALTYKGDELYLNPINWLGAQPMSYTSDRKKIDYGTLKFASYTQSGFSKYGKRHNWTLEDAADHKAFREFLGRRQGVAKPVWMPSGVQDFTLVEDALPSTNALFVKPNDYVSMIGQHPARRDILVELWDGTFFCRRIVASTNEVQGTRLELDDTHGVEVLVGGVKRISYLNWYRFAAPSTTIRHLTAEVATVEALMVVKKPKD